jgi:hypothetical protein
MSMDVSSNTLINISDEVILEMVEDEELDDFYDELSKDIANNIDSTDSSDFTDDIEDSINIMAEFMTMEEIDKLIFEKE